MGFSLLQFSLDIPPIENLKRAFRSVKCLTDFDALTIAKDAFGILVKNLIDADAATLHGALLTEGIRTEIINDSLLPKLPPSKQVRRLECSPQCLSVYDPLGRSFPLEWKHIMMILAGRIMLNDFAVCSPERPAFSKDRFTNSIYVKQQESCAQERMREHVILEIVLQRAVMRYVMDAKEFDFRSLGHRRENESNANVRLLTQDLTRYAPHAALNRGAYCLREDQRESFFYPSRNAFDEEMIWLLYQIQNGRYYSLNLNHPRRQ